jgi:hypothetical protein
VVGAFYVQAINKDAPHPAAARLWQEFLYSDEGQNIWLQGFARPVRLEVAGHREPPAPDVQRIDGLPGAWPVILAALVVGIGFVVAGLLPLWMLLVLLARDAVVLAVGAVLLARGSRPPPRRYRRPPTALRCACGARRAFRLAPAERSRRPRAG